MGADDVRAMLLGDSGQEGAQDVKPGSQPAEGAEGPSQEPEEGQQTPGADGADDGAAQEPAEGQKPGQDDGQEEPEGAPQEAPEPDTEEDNDDDDDLTDLSSDRARERIVESRKQVKEAREQAEAAAQREQQAQQEAEGLKAVLEFMRERPDLTFQQAVVAMFNPDQSPEGAPMPNMAAPTAEGPQTLEDFIQQVAQEEAFAGEDDAFIAEIARQRHENHQVRQEVLQAKQAIATIVSYWQMEKEQGATQQIEAARAENDKWASGEIDTVIAGSKGALIPDEAPDIQRDAYDRYFKAVDSMNNEEKAAADSKVLMKSCIKAAADARIRLYQKKAATQRPNAGAEKTPPARFQARSGTPPPVTSDVPKDFEEFKAGLLASVRGDGRA